MGNIMDKWFGVDPPAKPKPPAPPPEAVDIKGQKDLKKKTMLRRKGRKSTILAGLGKGDSSKNTLLG